MPSQIERARALVTQLRSEFKTVILGTTSPAGEPDASPVAATLGDEGAFYIYVSGLAAHTRHLRANPRASVLLVEDEAATAHPFARRRLTFACNATNVPPNGAEFVQTMAALREKFGATVDMLALLPDFQLVGLAPQSGRLVAGFGEAFDVDPLDWTKLKPIGRPGGMPADPR